MTEENVATRLKHFMEYRGLSHSQFADSCGIPRPTLSQLLSGRNKKVSDLLIGQIHRAYPDLSVVWLLFGEGEMTTGADLSVSQSELEADEDSVFTTDFTDEKIFSKETVLDGQVFPHLSSVNEDVVRNNVGAGNLCHPAVSVKKPRKVIQITVYYDDSTFETFYPENV